MNIIPLKKTALVCLSFLISSVSHANWHTLKSNPSYSPTTLTHQLNKQHVVQFLSSNSAIKAEGIKNTLILQGFPAFVRTNTLNGTLFYQVQVGPFDSHISAKNAKLKIINEYPQYSFLKDAIVKKTL